MDPFVHQISGYHCVSRRHPARPPAPGRRAAAPPQAHDSMTQLFFTCTLWFGAIGCGLLAGLYFAFSAVIMTALGRIEQAQGVSAMNSINSTILGVPVHAVLVRYDPGESHTCYQRSGSKGRARRDGDACRRADICRWHVFCAIVFNVPLNDAQAPVDPASGAVAPVWARFLKDWTVGTTNGRFRPPPPARSTSRSLRPSERTDFISEALIVVLRPGTPDDAPHVAAIWCAGWRDGPLCQLGVTQTSRYDIRCGIIGQ